jgi:hypothetical protein
MLNSLLNLSNILTRNTRFFPLLHRIFHLGTHFTDNRDYNKYANLDLKLLVGMATWLYVTKSHSEMTNVSFYKFKCTCVEL